MLRIDSHGIMIDHLKSCRIDYIHVIGTSVGNVDARQVLSDNRAELIRPSFTVEIVGIDHGRHAEHRLDRMRRRAAGRLRRGSDIQKKKQRRDGEAYDYFIGVILQTSIHVILQTHMRLPNEG